MRDTNSKRIDSVTVKRIADYAADTSDLGRYSDDPKDFAIVARGEHQGTFVDQLPCECGLAESEHTACDDGLGDSPRGDFEFDCVIDDHCHEFDGVSVERGRDYRYFNPCAENYTGIDDAEIRKCCLQDFERMQDLDRGEWCFVGVRADAQILIPNGSQGSSTIQTITSGGLWGIESDSGEYFKEVEKEQLDELRDQLHALGFSKRAISAAFRNVEHKDA